MDSLPVPTTCKVQVFLAVPRETTASKQQDPSSTSMDCTDLTILSAEQRKNKEKSLDEIMFFPMHAGIFSFSMFSSQNTAFYSPHI